MTGRHAWWPGWETRRARGHTWGEWARLGLSVVSVACSFAAIGLWLVAR